MWICTDTQLLLYYYGCNGSETQDETATQMSTVLSLRTKTQKQNKSWSINWTVPYKARSELSHGFGDSLHPFIWALQKFRSVYSLVLWKENISVPVKSGLESVCNCYSFHQCSLQTALHLQVISTGFYTMFLREITFYSVVFYGSNDEKRKSRFSFSYRACPTLHFCKKMIPRLTFLTWRFREAIPWYGGTHHLKHEVVGVWWFCQQWDQPIELIEGAGPAMNHYQRNSSSSLILLLGLHVQVMDIKALNRSSVNKTRLKTGQCSDWECVSSAASPSILVLKWGYWLSLSTCLLQSKSFLQ